MIETKIEGLKELDRKLAELTRQLHDRALRQSVGDAARLVRNKARQLVPVDTGLLKKNIIAARSRRNSKPGREQWNVALKQKTLKYGNTRANRRKNRVGKSYKVDGPAFYGAFIERGTSKMAARPFLRPALANNQQAAIEAFKKRMQEFFKKHGAKT